MIISRRILNLAFLALLLPAFPAPAAARQDDEPRPRIRVPVIEAAPEIDGSLDDPAWADAAVIDGMTEVEPDEGDPADPPTEIRIMRDREHVYIGFICHESRINDLVLQDMHREGFQDEDDAVKIVFDTFRDGKSGYYFLVSAAGGRLDALVADNGQYRNYNWDGFWRGRTSILSDRWIAEIAIPFKTMAFDADGIWRANFERWRGPDRSRSRWTGWDREFTITTVSEGGELEGFTDLDQGHGIELRPYAKAKRVREHSPRNATTTGDIGGELKWRITPQLNSSITLNTDFAETEADSRQINLTRFSLFFPEKRDFFLQDANQFNFGWENGFRGSPNVVPYFSRRIGLVDGEEIPIEYGGRLAGRVDDLDVGVLAVHTGDSNSADVPDGNLVVARPAWRVDEEWTVGGILTSGNPESRDDNTVGGADVKFVSTGLVDGVFTMNAYYVGSEDDESDDTGSAYGFRSTLDTSYWDAEFETLYTQDEFQPALGFVRRPGERRYAGRVNYEIRPESETFRTIEFSFRPRIWTEPDGSIITKAFTTEFLELNWHNGDEFFISHTVKGDKFDDDFEPVDGSVIPAGDYDWQTLNTGFIFSRSRKLSGSVTFEGGSWYNGHKYRGAVTGNWNPSPHLAIEASYVENRAQIPGKDFTTRIETLNVNYDFTPDVRLATLIQADNVSDNLGLQSRFRWVVEDGRELFFVINSSWVKEEDDSIVPVEQDYTMKVVYAVRF